LSQWAESRLSVPEDEDQVFVYGFEMKIDDLDPSKSFFRLVIGTKFLLKAATYSRHVCADTTHCMIWNGFPVFLAGTTDRGRHFHAFFQIGKKALAHVNTLLKNIFVHI
jgi:hypothetical protein